MSKPLRLLVARGDGTSLLDCELAAGQSFQWHEPDPVQTVGQERLLTCDLPRLRGYLPPEAAEIIDADMER